MNQILKTNPWDQKYFWIALNYLELQISWRKSVVLQIFYQKKKIIISRWIIYPILLAAYYGKSRNCPSWRKNLHYRFLIDLKHLVSHSSTDVVSVLSGEQQFYSHHGSLLSDHNSPSCHFGETLPDITGITKTINRAFIKDFIKPDTL